MIRTDWTPTLDEFRAFARLSGDANPIHVDPAQAAAHPFGAPVAHGMLIYARLRPLMLSTGLAPGAPVALMFPNPAYAGQALVLTAGLSGAEARRLDGTPVCLASWGGA